MKVGIVGLPLVGKTTVFNLLTRGDVDTTSWGGRGEAHVGVARVPDPRVDRLGELFKPKKVVHATVDYVDLPGLARGQGNAAAEGQALATYMHSLKNVEALLHVVRAFQDPRIPHSEGSLDPARDVHLFELEMILSDLAVVERRLDRLDRDLKKGKSPELELEADVLRRFKVALERETPLREIALTPEEARRVRGFTFMSAKPLLLVVNLGDRDAGQISRVVEAFGLEQVGAQKEVRVTAVCGKIEAEIASLPPDDARMFLEDLGLPAVGLDRIIQESHSLLGLISFYTAAEPEVRAWAIPRGTGAQQAAGVIHTDFEKGFIKAEVVSYSDMVELGSFQAARSKGALRLEGKDYEVREGDVILFRFNV